MISNIVLNQLSLLELIIKLSIVLLLWVHLLVSKANKTHTPTLHLQLKKTQRPERL